MLAYPLSRLAPLFLVLLSLLVINTTNLLPARVRAAVGGGLVVHEWGTFTSVVGREGYALSWRPLSFESDLPSFVYSVDKGATWLGGGLRYPTKSSFAVTVRMETPVLYFYAQEETNVSVSVNFLRGRITEWYPQAAVARGKLGWAQVKIMPAGAQAPFPNDGRENHYYPARVTDANPVEVRGEQKIEQEKFLFYRGVGDFQLPLAVKLQGDKVAVHGMAGFTGRVVLFERRGGKTGYRMVDVTPDGATLERPALERTITDLRREMKAMLINGGLYEKEAEAMLNTWRDSWFEEGLRLFYLLPRKTTDAILPLSIAPAPVEIVRVLVGRTELITPEMERDVAEQLLKLEDPTESVRNTALKEINKYGRFVEPILHQVSAHTTDARLRQAAGKLLDKMG